MKTVTFRPLRRIKKTGKISVASYMGWRKVKTADYNRFNLIIGDEYKTFSGEEFVHNHQGELLYWYNYHVTEIHVFNHTALLDHDAIREQYRDYAIRWNAEREGANYLARGLDCDGVPTFSHMTQDYTATHWEDVSEFVPLTVSIVINHFGLFLYQLDNSYLKIGK